MRGHISKRGNKYSFVLDIGRDPVTKKRRQKRVSGFKTKKDATEAMTTMINELNRGMYVETTNDTFSDYLDRWLKHKKTRVAHSTYEHYKTYVDNHIKPAIGNVLVHELRPLILQDFYDSLLEQNKLAKQSIRHIQRIVSNCLNLGVKMGEIKTNVSTAIDPIRISKKEQLYWNKHEVDIFLDAAKDHIHYIAFYLAIFTGMRQGEILGLKWDSIDFDNKTLYVQRGLKKIEGGYELNDLKNSSSYRSIAMSDGLYEELKKHRKRQNEIKLKIGEGYDNQDFVVATKVGTFVLPTNLGRAFRLICNKLEIPKIRFHDLRHTHASLLFSQNIHPKIVQERLGHSSIEITLDTYSHMLPNMQESAAQKLDEMFENTSNKNLL